MNHQFQFYKINSPQIKVLKKALTLPLPPKRVPTVDFVSGMQTCLRHVGDAVAIHTATSKVAEI